ncbi:MAG: (d)CMP kinase [Thermoplasmatota archaeon]
MADRAPARAPARTVTVGGLPGTGTSTLCRLLEARLGLPYTYAGALFRAEAERRGMSLADFGALCQQDPAVDQALDDQQLELLRAGNVLLEGRLSGWLAHRHAIPALKVWVACDDGERLRRLVERDGGDPEAQKRATLEREASEADRYRRYYGADLADLAPYDLVLDSTAMTPEELAASVEEAAAAHAA